MFKWIEEFMESTGCDEETAYREYTYYLNNDSYYETYIEDEEPDYYGSFASAYDY